MKQDKIVLAIAFFVLSAGSGLAFFGGHSNASGLLSYVKRLVANESKSITTAAVSSATDPTSAPTDVLQNSLASSVAPSSATTTSSNPEDSADLQDTNGVQRYGVLEMTGSLVNLGTYYLHCGIDNFTLIDKTGYAESVIDNPEGWYLGGCESKLVPPGARTKFKVYFRHATFGKVGMLYRDADVAEAILTATITPTSGKE